MNAADAIQMLSHYIIFNQEPVANMKLRDNALDS